MKNHFLLLISVLFFSCSPDKVRDSKVLASKNILKLRDRTALCDTCSSFLFIQHDECSDCADLMVDSGTVYISKAIYETCDSLIKADSLLRKHPDTDGYLYLNTNDLSLSNKEVFYELWPDTITWGDFNKKYKVRGKVVKVSVQKRMGFNVIVPSFRIDSYTPLRAVN